MNEFAPIATIGEITLLHSNRPQGHHILDRGRHTTAMHYTCNLQHSLFQLLRRILFPRGGYGIFVRGSHCIVKVYYLVDSNVQEISEIRLWQNIVKNVER